MAAPLVVYTREEQRTVIRFSVSECDKPTNSHRSLRSRMRAPSVDYTSDAESLKVGGVKFALTQIALGVLALRTRLTPSLKSNDNRRSGTTTVTARHIMSSVTCCIHEKSLMSGQNSPLRVKRTSCECSWILRRCEAHYCTLSLGMNAKTNRTSKWRPRKWSQLEISYSPSLR